MMNLLTDRLSLGGPLNINYYSIYGLPNTVCPHHIVIEFVLALMTISFAFNPTRHRQTATTSTDAMGPVDANPVSHWRHGRQQRATVRNLIYGCPNGIAVHVCNILMV